MNRFVLALVLAALSSAPSLASQAPVPAPSGAPQARPAASSAPAAPQMVPMTQVQAYVQQLQASFGAFAQSVYAPACADHKGIKSDPKGGLAIDQLQKGVAFPAIVHCADGTLAYVQSVVFKTVTP